jgi:hypothetical protein
MTVDDSNMKDEFGRKVGTAGVGVHQGVHTAVFMVLLLGLIGGTPVHGQSPRAALEPFTGHWTGPFVAYTYAGEQVDSLTAEHRYRWEGDVQVGTQVDRYPDGRVVRHTARNFVRNDTLFCEVTHADGSTTVYRGRVVGEAIVWHRRTDAGLVESFRERVVETPDGPEYRIDGFGVYPNDDGSASHLQFVGRYRPAHQDSSKGRE